MAPKSGAGGAYWLGLAGLAGLARYPLPATRYPLDFSAGLAGPTTRNPNRKDYMFTPSTYLNTRHPSKGNG